MIARVIPFIKPEPVVAAPVVYLCSFCKREKAAVQAMVVGEVANICNDCLAHATHRMNETEETA